MLLFLAPLISLMPQATLAAVVIATSIGLISLTDFAASRRVRKAEFHWAAIQRAPLGQTLGRPRMFVNVAQAVEAYLGLRL